MPRPRILAALTAAACVLAMTVTAIPAMAAEHGTVLTAQAPSAAVGTIDYAVYLPPGYDDSTDSYPSVYLLHGRGDSLTAWQQVTNDLDDLINAGTIQPMVVVMPDAPWNSGGSWYTDSDYTGDQVETPGIQVETAFTRDLVAHIDATYRTVADRTGRAVGGYSMGGAGALRYALAHQDEFSAGLVLSPAAYTPQPPSDSSVRDYGAYGSGDDLFSSARYDELNYPAALASFDPALPVHLFIAVGDDEWANPDPADAEHDIDFESAKLYNAARRVPGVTAELRILNGGHNWDVWQPGFREGITSISTRLHTAPVQPWTADLIGSTADDRAGGILPLADGDLVAVAEGAALSGGTHVGGMDVTLLRRDQSGSVLWRHAVATSAADRSYGVVPGAGGAAIVAGYTRGNLDGSHPSGASDDGFVAGVSSSGDRLFTLQAGDAGAADRFYAIASDGAGGAYVAGYTSGSFAGSPSAGDKDAVVARVSPSGTLLWSRQLGGSGEDKALAVTAVDGGVVVGGIAGQAMPGQSSAGGYDGWVARLTDDGTLSWVRQVGTSATDQVTGLVTRSDGVVVAVGHTGGTLGAASKGENDVFATAFGADGSRTWTTQLGSAQDDRGVLAVARAGGVVQVVATTYGALGDPAGDNDLATVSLDADGTPGSWRQFGSAERDGADEWDEANLYAAVGPTGTVELSGLTFGAPSGATNLGAGDVFVMSLAAQAIEIDFSALERVIDDAEALAAGDYTTSSWASLTAALADAGEVLADARAGEADRAEVAAAVEAVTNAVTGLVLRGDAQVLDALIRTADGLTASLGGFTDASANALRSALASAKATYAARADRTQAQLDAAGDALRSAVAGLTAKSSDPDKTVLRHLFTSAKALTNTGGAYTSASWAKLQAELGDAKAVLDNGSATQVQINQAALELSSALAGLTPAPKPAAVVTKVKLNQAQLRLVKGRSFTLEEGVYFKNLHSSYAGSVTWKSSDTRIATVTDAGTVKAKKTGTVTISVTTTQADAAGKRLSAGIKVTVVAKKSSAKVTKVTAGVPRTLKLGQSVYVTGKYSPSRATGVKVTYSSSRSSVADVDPIGRILAKSKGTAVITVKAGGKTHTYKVTVK